MFSFLSDNIITITVILVFLVAVYVYFKFAKFRTKYKISDFSFHHLTNKEYKVYCKNSEKAIINTTVSFNASLCSDENEIDDMYSKTVLVGNKIICNDGYKLSKVGKV